MATFSESLQFDVTLDASGFEKGTKKIAKDAKTVSEKVSTGFQKSGTMVADSAKKASKASQKAFGDIADGAGDSEQALIGVADLLEFIDPQLAAVARGMADVGGGIEGVVKGGSNMVSVLARIGPIAAGVGVLALAYDNASKALDKANAKIERNRKELKDQVALIREVRDAELAAAIATGDLTEAEGQQLLIAQKSEDVFGARLEALKAEQAQLELNQRTAAKQVEDIEASALATGSLSATLDLQNAIVDDSTQKLTVNASKIRILEGMMAKYEESLGVTEDVKTFNEALKVTDTAAADAADAISQLGEITRSAEASGQEGIEAVITARGESLNQINELASKTDDLAAIEAARAAVVADAERQITEIRREAADEALKIAGSQAAAEKALSDSVDENIQIGLAARADAITAASLQMASATAGAIGMIFGEMLSQQQGLISSERESFEAMDKADREATRDAFIEEQRLRKEQAISFFRGEKAAALSQAIINGALGVTAALTNPVTAPFVIPGIIAATAAQTAVIAAQPPPTFHQGGVVSSAGERTVTARDGEAFLTQQGRRTAGLDTAAAVRDTNAGRTGQRTQVIEMRVGAQTTERQWLTGQGASGQQRQDTRTLRRSGQTNPYVS